MTWFRVDDSFHSHPKVDLCTPASLGLWLMAGAWSAQHLQDGFVPDSRIGKLGFTSKDARALVFAKLWDEVEGGYQFHDWTDHQPSRDQVEDRRKADAERKAQARAAKAAQVKQEVGAESAESPDGHGADSAGTLLGVRSTRPDPTRPDLKELVVASVDNSPPGDAADDRPAADRVLANWRHRRAGPRNSSIERLVGKQVRGLLEAGHPEAVVAEALVRYDDRRRNGGTATPTLIPLFVADITDGQQPVREHAPEYTETAPRFQ